MLTLFCPLTLNDGTVDYRYNEPRTEMKNSSLYREFVKSKLEKEIGKDWKKSEVFDQILNPVLEFTYIYFFQLINQKMIKDVFFLFSS